MAVEAAELKVDILLEFFSLSMNYYSYVLYFYFGHWQIDHYVGLRSIPEDISIDFNIPLCCINLSKYLPQNAEKRYWERRE